MEGKPWVVRLMRLLVAGSEPVEGLFVPGTFDRGPPVQVRARAWRYRFTAPGSSGVWDREDLGAYCEGVVD